MINGDHGDDYDNGEEWDMIRLITLHYVYKNLVLLGASHNEDSC